MVKQVGHVGLLVESLDETAKLYQELFGATLDEVKTVAEQGVRVGMLGFGSGAKLELLEPLPDSRMAAALEKRGEGVQHVSFDVDDIEAEIASLVEKGVELIDKKPRRGVEGMVAFIHPKSVKGVLVELCQRD
ncbi:MAG: methylmalonyl-CoA epimerase [Chloroflexi bacterium]|nr:methylmalonyl-CoA epimerase [Chloroflexota bacterium]